jgi:hypothetical protein
MLTLGIAIMVAAIVLGIVTLTSVALMSSAARSAGRRARTAVTRSDRGDPSYQDLFGSTERDTRSYPGEVEDPPRWILGLTMLCGGGLVVGLLLVAIASIP